MAVQTERKQVLVVGDKISQLAPVANKPTPKKVDGSLHGLVKNLTMKGAGFVPTP